MKRNQTTSKIQKSEGIYECEKEKLKQVKNLVSFLVADIKEISIHNHYFYIVLQNLSQNEPTFLMLNRISLLFRKISYCPIKRRLVNIRFTTQISQKVFYISLEEAPSAPANFVFVWISQLPGNYRTPVFKFSVHSLGRQII